MESSGCLSSVVRKLTGVQQEDLEDLLLCKQSRHFELTKSLLNILFNLVKTQSIRPSKTTKQTIDRNEELVWQLLSPAASLDEKTRRLADCLDLVYALARSCPSESSS
jgi:hypothetical protein